MIAMAICLLSLPLCTIAEEDDDFIYRIELEGSINDTDDILIAAEQISIAQEASVISCQFGMQLGATQISIVSANGATVYNQQCAISNGQSIQIDLSQLPAGSYTLYIDDLDAGKVYGNFVINPINN